MKVMHLVRVAYAKEATFGVLIDNGIPFAVTMEPPWRDNRPFVSCIPEGTYTCRKGTFRVHGDAYEVRDVPNRSAILIHTGNAPKDTEGCILVGEEFEGEGIRHSGKGYREFIARLNGVDEFKLVIGSCNG